MLRNMLGLFSSPDKQPIQPNDSGESAFLDYPSIEESAFNDYQQLNKHRKQIDKMTDNLAATLPAGSYVEFPVEQKPLVQRAMSQVLSSFQSKGDINIVLEDEQSVSDKELPYADYFTPEKLAEWGMKRLNQRSRLFWRGDETPLEKFIEAGGIHPRPLRKEGSPDDAFKDMLDVNDHLNSSKGSGYVSFTGSKSCAKYYGESYSNKPTNEYDKKFSLYLVKTQGAIDTGSQEREYSMPGGVDPNAIVSVRQCMRVHPSYPLDCGSIKVSTDFINKHPNYVDAVLNANLDPHEQVVKNSFKRKL